MSGGDDCALLRVAPSPAKSRAERDDTSTSANFGAVWVIKAACIVSFSCRHVESCPELIACLQATSVSVSR